MKVNPTKYLTAEEAQLLRDWRHNPAVQLLVRAAEAAGAEEAAAVIEKPNIAPDAGTKHTLFRLGCVYGFGFLPALLAGALEYANATQEKKP